MKLIKELRKKKGISQKQLANYLNIADSTLSYWEQGKFQPDNESLLKIADYFNVTTDYLLERNVDNSTLNKSEKINTVVIRQRNGITLEKQLTDSQIELIQQMVKAIPSDDNDI